MRSFILIAYKYPPYDQVGSLRWTKLSKYLAKLGHTIHVITIDWDGIGNKKTLIDVKHPNIHIHVIPSGYPHKLKYKPLKNKYLNFIKSLPFRYFLDKFICFDDEAQVWQKSLSKKLEELTTTLNIDTIITTGGPFQAIRWASYFKKKSKRKIKLIHDFRDPWASDPFKSITKSQRAQIFQWQKECVDAADNIVAVTQILLDEYLETTTNKDKGIIITNGFDPESAPKLENNSTPLIPGRITLFHAGNIANGRETPLLELLGLLNRNAKLRERFVVCLAGDLGLAMTMKLNHIFPEVIKSESLIFIKRIPQSEVFKMISASTFALHLNGPELPCANSTKIFEYGMMKKPTVSLNYGGEVDQLIRRNDLGYSINLSNTDLEAALTSITESSDVDFQINIEEYSHPNLAAKYSELINSL